MVCLFTTLKTGIFESKQSGWQVSHLKAQLEEKSEGLSCSASPCTTWAKSARRPRSAKSKACTMQPEALLSVLLTETPSPAARSQEHSCDTNPVLLCWPGFMGLKKVTSCKDQPPAHGCGQASPVLLRWLTLTPFWQRAPAAPPGRRMTSHFLNLQSPSDTQAGYRWEGQRAVHSTDRYFTNPSLTHTHTKPASVKQVWSAK